MNEIDLVGESIKFMILGMIIVFAFLYLLVLLMQLQAYLINRFFPEKPQASSAAQGNEDASRITAAIIAAIAEHKKNKSTK